MPEIKPPAPEPMPRKITSSMVIVAGDNEGMVSVSLNELAKVRDIIRNNTLCEVLGAVTDKLNPAGDTTRELALVEVLRTVNDMRTEVRQ